MKEKQTTSLLVRLTPRGYVLWHRPLACESLVIGALVRLIARHLSWFAGGLTATLAAKVAILFLCGRNEPKTATRVT